MQHTAWLLSIHHQDQEATAAVPDELTRSGKWLSSPEQHGGFKDLPAGTHDLPHRLEHAAD